MAISVTNPIAPAFERAKLMTFQPFDLGKWLVLGFIAFLAILGEGGGGGFNFGNFGGGGGGRRPIPVPGPGGTTQIAPADVSQHVWDWIAANGVFALFIAAIALVVFFAFALLVLWLSSRGRFMLLRAIATNTTQVVAPWKQYRELANNLFVFRASLLFAGVLANFAIVVFALLIAWPDIRAQSLGVRSVAAMILGVALFIPTALLLGLVSWCTDHFVTTIMYARSCSVREAWRDFGQNVMSGNIGPLVLFLLMRIVFTLAVVLAHMVVGCVTCCIGFLPYVGTVVTLPLILFMRCYSIYFLQQFGPQYVIVQEAAPPPPPGAFPVIPPANRGY